MSYRTSSLVVMPVLLGLLGACDSGEKRAAPVHTSPPASGPVKTHAKAPDPCKLIAGALANELVGTSSGRADPDGKSVDPSRHECEWTSPRGIGVKSKREGSIELLAYTQLIRGPGEEEYLRARTNYRAAARDKTCRTIEIGSGEACWYAQKLLNGVVIREGYVVVWIRCAPLDAPKFNGREWPTTATRIARDVARNLS